MSGISPRVLGVIPARGGSKRVPNKNLRFVAGKPLLAYTIEAVKQSRHLCEFVISTENRKIAEIANQFGASVVKRPEEYASDRASSAEVIQHCLDWFGHNEFDIAICLHPTSPIRDPKHIDRVIDILWASDAPGVVSVECRKRTYTHNASIYAVKVPWFLKTGKLYCDESIPFLMDRAHSVDIDEPADLALAEFYLKNGIFTNQRG